MDYLHYFWSKFKHEPDIWFFYGFLLSFSFSIRKVLLYFPIQGTFNEYTGIYVYISDIFLFFTMLSWTIFILSNKILFLSNLKLWITSCLHTLYSKFLLESKFLFRNFSQNRVKSYIKDIPNLHQKRFHVEHFSFLLIGIFIITPLIIVIWAFISIAWSHNQTVAFFRSIKLFEYYLLYLYIIFRITPNLFNNHSTSVPRNVPRGTFFAGWNNFMLLIIIIALFQSFIAIFQFILQHYIGLFCLKESLISPEIAGVAKIIINGHTYIRTYGLFPHPNILGGFLLFSITITLLYGKMFHSVKNKIVLRLPRFLKMFHVEHFKNLRGETMINILILIQSLALLLTFSKSAIIGITICLFYIYVLLPPREMFHMEHKNISPCKRDGWGEVNVLHGTILPKFYSDPNRRVIILIFLILINLSYLSWNNFYPMLYNSIQQRVIYLNVSRGTILSNPVLGVGIGQFVLNMQIYFNNLELWQFQPVHNVFLLILSELGIVGLGLCIYWLYRMFHPVKLSNVPHGTSANHGTSVEQKLSNREVASGTKSILQNKYNYLSNSVTLHYFKGILLGFIFIMLFDHYFWDIQQGSIMLWMTAGFIAGIKRNC